MALRIQSATEYLMTYGWAIVAVAVALGVLYSLGVFGLGTTSASGCTVISGFTCSKPVLFSSGILTLGFGQIGNGKTITATGCSSNGRSPTTWESTNITLGSGQVANLSFVCPVAAGSKIGTLFSGTLWIQYTTSAQSSSVTTQAVAAVKIPVGEGGLPRTPSNTVYVPITLLNSQSNSTGANFQQNITFNPSTYSPSVEANDLGNIRFYQGSSELYSWCESGCTIGSGKAVFWVNIPSGIDANSNMTVYMTFGANTLEYDGVYAGEAPQLSSSYAKYDNGAYVFPELYVNFAGTSVPSGWARIGIPDVVISNGLAINGQYNDGVGGGEIYYSGFQMAVPGILDTYTSMSDSGWAAAEVGMSSSQLASILGYASIGGRQGNTTAIFYTTGYNALPSQPSAGYHIWSMLESPSMAAGQYDYNAGSQFSLSYPNSAPYGSLSIEGLAPNHNVASTATADTYWIRVRGYPPNGVMPSAAFGAQTSS
jgi:hypothetical protein